jgi:FAD-dependent urate hydroxylase
MLLWVDAVWSILSERETQTWGVPLSRAAQPFEVRSPDAQQGAQYRESERMENCDVAIVGAGPYGLSTAAYLQQIKGLEVRVFGKPMDFWERCMPPRMLLRSHWHATHIADPKDGLTLDSFASSNGNRGLAEPIPVSEFIRYGRWFLDEANIRSDQRKIARLSASSGRFKLTLEDGEVMGAKRVIVATGIECFAYKPPIFDSIPSGLASHPCELRDYTAFKDKDVVVIGGGQSALESGAFLHANGARVQILVRQTAQVCKPSRFRWLGNPSWLKLLRGRGDVGPAGVSLIIQRPSLFGRLPRRVQTKWDRRAIKLGFSYRLAPEINAETVRSGVSIDQVQVQGQRLLLELSDGTERLVDFAVLATGYRVNVAACPFWGRGILDGLALVGGYPRLDAGLESSVPGLHFVGAMAAYSFGPLMRFVSGTGFAAASVARRVRLRAKADARQSIGIGAVPEASHEQPQPRLASSAAQGYFPGTEFSGYETARAARRSEQAEAD